MDQSKSREGDGAFQRDGQCVWSKPSVKSQCGGGDTVCPTGPPGEYGFHLLFFYSCAHLPLVIYLFIEALLTYNIILVSGVQHSDCVFTDCIPFKVVTK